MFRSLVDIHKFLSLIHCVGLAFMQSNTDHQSNYNMLTLEDIDHTYHEKSIPCYKCRIGFATMLVLGNIIYLVYINEVPTLPLRILQCTTYANI